MKKRLLIIARMGMFLTAIGVYPAHARDYVKFTCLPEAHTFIVEATCLDDEVVFEKSTDDWGKRIIAEAKKQQMYPAGYGTEFTCAITPSPEDKKYKFEIVRIKGIDKSRLWFGDQLIMDLDDASPNPASLKGIGCVPDKYSSTISKIQIGNTDALQLTIHQWRGEMNRASREDALRINENVMNVYATIRKEAEPINSADIISMSKENGK